MGVLKPELLFKSTVPIIMAGILGIYGLIVSVILQGKGKIFLTLSTVASTKYTEADGYKHLASGLCCGLSSLVSAQTLTTLAGRRTHHWNRRRRRCQSQRPAGADLRCHDPHPHLRRGAGSLRNDRCHHPLSGLLNAKS